MPLAFASCIRIVVDVMNNALARLCHTLAMHMRSSHGKSEKFFFNLLEQVLEYIYCMPDAPTPPPSSPQCTSARTPLADCGSSHAATTAGPTSHLPSLSLLHAWQQHEQHNRICAANRARQASTQTTTTFTTHAPAAPCYL